MYRTLLEEHVLESVVALWREDYGRDSELTFDVVEPRSPILTWRSTAAVGIERITARGSLDMRITSGDHHTAQAIATYSIETGLIMRKCRK